MTERQLLSIGEVSEATGVSVSALRYYDEIGLIESATRVGGKRRFAPSTVGRVSFVRRAQDASFSLDEIQGLLDEGATDWRATVDTKLAELRARRDRIDELMALLGELRTCGCDSIASCSRAAVG